MLGKKVNDPEIVEMDDITWTWHYASWLEEREERVKMMRSFGCFVGGFFNAKAARQIQEMDDESKKIGVSEEEFDAASEYVRKSGEERDKIKKKRNKKLVIKNRK